VDYGQLSSWDTLTLWHSMRTDSGPALQNPAQGMNRLLASAMAGGCVVMLSELSGGKLSNHACFRS
jgi:hypothetical protein